MKIFYLLFIFLISCQLKTVHKWEEPIKEGKLNLFIVRNVLSSNQIQLTDGKLVQYMGLSNSKKLQQICKEANQWLLRIGKIFLEFPEIQPNKEGIYLAYAYVPTPKGLCFINQELLEFGYCELDPNFQDPKYKEAFFELQKEAQSKKRGIWASPQDLLILISKGILYMMLKEMESLYSLDMFGKGDIDWILGGEHAIHTLKAKIDMDSKFSEAYKAFLDKKYKEAANRFENLQKKYSQEKNLFCAFVLSTMGHDISKAEKLLKDISAINQTIYYHLKGLLEEKKGNIDQALGYYLQAISENDSFFPSIFRLAYYVNLRGDDEIAVKIYEKALKNNILYSHFLINLGLLYEDNGQFYRALECYKKILQKFPGHPRASLYYKDAEASLNMYVDEDKAREQDKQNQILGTPITDFELSVRSKNCLNKMKIKILGDLIKKTEAELLSYKNFGETSLAEIKDILNKKGLKLGMGREEEDGKKREKKTVKTAKIPDNKEILDIPISNVFDDVRIRKCMLGLEIKTLGELIQKKDEDLLKCKNFGVTSIINVKKKLDEYGLSLCEEDQSNKMQALLSQSFPIYSI